MQKGQRNYVGKSKTYNFTRILNVWTIMEAYVKLKVGCISKSYHFYVTGGNKTHSFSQQTLYIYQNNI